MRRFGKRAILILMLIFACGVCVVYLVPRLKSSIMSRFEVIPQMDFNSHILDNLQQPKLKQHIPPVHDPYIIGNTEQKNPPSQEKYADHYDSNERCPTLDIRTLHCNLNGVKSKASCLWHQGEAFVPFSLVEQYFEIYGQVDKDTLYWWHTNSRFHRKFLPYSATGAFIFFAQYNVAQRERVLIVTADEGVPLSTQWDPHGYPYPIQIAQFGLEHYSKLVRQQGRGEEAEVNLLSGDVGWSVPQGASFQRSKQTGTVKFTSSDDVGLELPLTNEQSFISSQTERVPYPLLVVKGNWALGTRLTVRLVWGQMDAVQVVFVCSRRKQRAKDTNQWVSVSDDHLVVTYWMPQCATADQDTPFAVHLVRDLRLDLEKSFLKKKRKAVRKWRLKGVTSVSLGGSGSLSLLKLTTTAHRDQFLLAAHWFLRHQDAKGGWPVPVARRLRGSKKLNPGWYSAMGQGHAISLLVRAFNHTGDRSFLTAAEKATKLFSVPSAQGGVMAHFLTSKMVWYEEYPTTPSLYVLNGFIYSLIGLYDLDQVTSAVSTESTIAGQLYRAGLRSLRSLLPLFDTGSGSLYDLRHGSGTGDPRLGPNRARWDYHVIHVEQLSLLASLDPGSALWGETMKRWSGYMQGLRSPHN